MPPRRPHRRRWTSAGWTPARSDRRRPRGAPPSRVRREMKMREAPRGRARPRETPTRTARTSSRGRTPTPRDGYAPLATSDRSPDRPASPARPREPNRMCRKPRDRWFPKSPSRRVIPRFSARASDSSDALLSFRQNFVSALFSSLSFLSRAGGSRVSRAPARAHDDRLDRPVQAHQPQLLRD